MKKYFPLFFTLLLSDRNFLNILLSIFPVSTQKVSFDFSFPFF